MATSNSWKLLDNHGKNPYISLWIFLIVAVKPGVAGCPEDEAAFQGCFGQFNAMEQSDTFWQQLCSTTGRGVVDCLYERTENCTHFWTDTQLGDLTYAKNLLSFETYNGDYNIACEIETVQDCKEAWDCYFSVFGASVQYRHEGLAAFHELYCGTVRGCLQSLGPDQCLAVTGYLRQSEVIEFSSGDVLTYQEVEDKVRIECAKIDAVSINTCLGEPSSDSKICLTFPVVTHSFTFCRYTDHTASCLEDKCGAETATFYISMFNFLRCGAEVKACGKDVYGDIIFEPTFPETTVSLECSVGQNGTLSRTCDKTGDWEAVVDDCEWELDDIHTTIEDLKNADSISDAQAEKVLKDVKTVTEPAKIKKPPLVEVRNLANDITLIMGKKAVLKEEESNDFFEIMSNTLDRPEEEWKELINEDKEGANRILENTDTIVRKLQTQDCSVLQADNFVTFTKTNLDVTLGKAAGGITFTAGSTAEDKRGEIHIEDETIQNLGEEVCFGGVHYRKAAAIITPRLSVNGAVQKFSDDMSINSDVLSLQLGQPLANGDSLVTVVAYHRKHEIFQTEQDLHWWGGIKLLYHGLSACARDNPLAKAPGLSHLTGRQIMMGYVDPKCIFLDFAIPGTNGTGAWSTDGCYVKSTTSSKTICQCTHLTNFAVLMSIKPLDKEHALALSFISAVGCFVSMLGLLATIICHGLVWRYVRSDRAVILMNLCCALLIALAVFLAGINRTESKVACTVIAGVLQFLFLVVFFMMLLKGIEILLCVVRLFTIKFPLVPLLIFAWLVPAAIVAISMVISLVVTKTGGYGTKEHCWLSLDSGLIWAFVGPAAFVILINCIVIIIIFRKMASTTVLKGKTTKQQLTTCARSLCVLLPLMGCSWVFGVLSVNRDLVVFQYFFCILNSLQGVFIFIFHCVYNQQLRDALRKRKARKVSQGSFKTTLQRSKSDSADDSRHYQRSEKSNRKVKRNLSDSRTSSSSKKGHSETPSHTDPFEDWQKDQRKKYQKDLRMKTPHKLEWTHV